MYMQTPTSYTTYAEQHLAARLEDEQSLSMQLAEAAEAAQCRSRARQSLLTLELIHADDDVSAAVAHANIYRRRAENAAAEAERLRLQLSALAEYAERGTLERLGVLNPEIAELEELAAIGQVGTFVEVDIDLLAVFLQRFQLLLIAEDKALVHERCLRPWPVQFGDKHTELEFFYWDFFFHFGIEMLSRDSRYPSADSPS